jgi:hypothetical protein
VALPWFLWFFAAGSQRNGRSTCDGQNLSVAILQASIELPPRVCPRSSRVRGSIPLFNNGRLHIANDGPVTGRSYIAAGAADVET